MLKGSKFGSIAMILAYACYFVFYYDGIHNTASSLTDLLVGYIFIIIALIITLRYEKSLKNSLYTPSVLFCGAICFILAFGLLLFACILLNHWFLIYLVLYIAISIFVKDK